MQQFKPIEPHPDFSKIEEEILEFWEKNKIFEQSLKKTKDGKPFSFYDGPPFATGLPHYGHILASTIKDVIPRYQTMKGRFVRRRWGWDCHGLPIEEIVERELGISGKKDIEKIGIKKFNETCRSTVLRHAEEWGKMIRRIARWVEFDNAYKTMDHDYMESVWWAFKKIYKKGLIYKGRRVLLYCSRCETPISKFEVAMDSSYQTITEEALTVKFKVRPGQKVGGREVPENTYFLAWTTTPWTLVGNVTLAVGKDINYVKVRHGSEFYIVAKDRAEDVFKDDVEIEEEFKGSTLVGLEYEPLFDVPAVHSERSYKVYPGEFVSTEEGTGIVHTAVVYGEGDYELGLKYNLPIEPLLDEKGLFNEKAPQFIRNTYFKNAEKKITGDLEERNLIFARSQHKHSYPYCWRCGTTLFYNAIPAWFINIQKIKKKILRTNKKEINWYPGHLKHGRYEKSVEAAPDWNISRNRYWGNPIPIWQCDNEDCVHPQAIGSLEELNKYRYDRPTTFLLMRHGEALANKRQVVSSYPETFENLLTSKGKKEVERAAKKLRREKIDVIYTSDLNRTKQTAEILAKLLGVELKVNEALREIDVGELNGKSVGEYHHFFAFLRERLFKAPVGGEDWLDVRERIWKFARETENKHSGKTVLVVSHGLPLALFESTLRGVSTDELLLWEEEHELKTGKFHEVTFPNWPFNDKGEVDLHRPYIDEVVIRCEKCGGKTRRITEIFDSWTEAGSMPFAEYHYPFENKYEFKSRFPAQFVTEYIAQTRAWFYVMHVISQILFKKAPFENVVTTGTILAEDGSKLSKSKGNFPDPWEVIGRYGVDALRFYLMNSPVMQADDLNFSERGVQKVYRRVILILWNVYNYFVTYANEANWQYDPAVSPGQVKNSPHLLDQWINARLEQLIGAMTKNLDTYNTVGATRALENFIQDLSTWYVRRSRGRNDNNFFATLYRCLIYVTKVSAPFTPYIAEHIYQNIHYSDYASSIHLDDWPEEKGLRQEENDLLRNMAMVRNLASAALAARAKTGIKVRQKLGKLTVSKEDARSIEGLETVLKDEVNVAKISFSDSLKSGQVQLDTAITPELEREGVFREIVRTVNDLRKKAGLTPKDKIELYFNIKRPGGKNDELGDLQETLKQETRSKNVIFGHEPHSSLLIEREFSEKGWQIWLGIKKSNKE